jgi:hypothetical protein
LISRGVEKRDISGLLISEFKKNNEAGNIPLMSEKCKVFELRRPTSASCLR